MWTIQGVTASINKYTDFGNKKVTTHKRQITKKNTRKSRTHPNTKHLKGTKMSRFIFVCNSVLRKICVECLWCGILVESEWIGWMRLIEAHGEATNGIDDHMWVQAKLLHFKRILPLNSLLYFALFVLNSLLSAFSSTIKCPCNLEHFCRIFTLLTFVIRFNGYHAKINFNWLQ